jgi:hypothetical protein
MQSTYQASPSSMIVPVPPFQHSPMFGHCASSQTVFSSRFRNDSLTSTYRESSAAREGKQAINGWMSDFYIKTLPCAPFLRLRTLRRSWDPEPGRTTVWHLGAYLGPFQFTDVIFDNVLVGHSETSASRGSISAGDRIRNLGRLGGGIL